MSRPRQPADEAAPLLAAVLLLYLGCLLMFRRLSTLLGQGRPAPEALPAPEPQPPAEDASSTVDSTQVILDNKALMREVFTAEPEPVPVGGDEGQQVSSSSSSKISEIVEARYERERRRSRRPASSAAEELEGHLLKSASDASILTQGSPSIKRFSVELGDGLRVSHGKKRLAPPPPSPRAAEKVSPERPALSEILEAEVKGTPASELELQSQKAAKEVGGTLRPVKRLAPQPPVRQFSSPELKVSSLEKKEFGAKTSFGLQKSDSVAIPKSPDEFASGLRLSSSLDARNYEFSSILESGEPSSVQNGAPLKINGSALIQTFADSSKANNSKEEKPVEPKLNGGPSNSKDIVTTAPNGTESTEKAKEVASIVPITAVVAPISSIKAPIEQKSNGGLLTSIEAVKVETPVPKKDIVVENSVKPLPPTIISNDFLKAKTPTTELKSNGSPIEPKDVVAEKVVETEPLVKAKETAGDVASKSSPLAILEEQKVSNAQLGLKDEKHTELKLNGVPLNSTEKVNGADEASESQPAPQEKAKEPVAENSINKSLPIKPLAENKEGKEADKSPAVIVDSVSALPNNSTVEVKNEENSTKAPAPTPIVENDETEKKQTVIPDSTDSAIKSPVPSAPISFTNDAAAETGFKTTTPEQAAEVKTECHTTIIETSEKHAPSLVEAEKKVENPPTVVETNSASTVAPDPSNSIKGIEAAVDTKLLNGSKSDRENIQNKTESGVANHGAPETSESPGSSEATATALVNSVPIINQRGTPEAVGEVVNPAAAAAAKVCGPAPQQSTGAEANAKRVETQGCTSPPLNNNVLEKAAGECVSGQVGEKVQVERTATKEEESTEAAAAVADKEAAAPLHSESEESAKSPTAVAQSEKVAVSADSTIPAAPPVDKNNKSEPRANGVETGENCTDNSPNVSHRTDNASGAKLANAEVLGKPGGVECPAKEAACTAPPAAPSVSISKRSELKRSTESLSARRKHLTAAQSFDREEKAESNLIKKIESFLVTEDMAAAQVDSGQATDLNRGKSFRKLSASPRTRPKVEKDKVEEEANKNGEQCGIQSAVPGKQNNADKKIKQGLEDATKLAAAAGKQPTQATPRIGFGALRPRPKSGVGSVTSDPLQLRPKSDELSEVFNKIVLRKTEESKAAAAAAAGPRRNSLKTKPPTKTKPKPKEKSPKLREKENGDAAAVSPPQPPANNKTADTVAASEVTQVQTSVGEEKSDTAKSANTIVEQPPITNSVTGGAAGPDLCAAGAEKVGVVASTATAAAAPPATRATETRKSPVKEAAKSAAGQGAINAAGVKNSGAPAKHEKTPNGSASNEEKEKVAQPDETTVRGKLVLGQRPATKKEGSPPKKVQQPAEPPAAAKSMSERAAKRLEHIRATKAEETAATAPEEPKPVIIDSGVTVEPVVEEPPPVVAKVAERVEEPVAKTAEGGEGATAMAVEGVANQTVEGAEGGIGLVVANTGRKVGDTRYLTEMQVFFRPGVLGQLEAQRDEKLQDHVMRLQARCRGYLARRRFDKRKVQEVAIRCVQRNVRRFIKVRDWPWWRLLVRVAPLLNVHRAEEELRKQTEELEGLKVRLDKSEAEKLRLKQQNERLESRMNELTVALAEEQSASSLASERLETETAERARLQHELQNAQEKQSSLREASQRLEMEILMCRAADDSSHASGEEDDVGLDHLRQRLERSVKEAAGLRRQLQQQQENHEDQLMALRKATEKRVADALEEVEEQRQVVAQMKRKAQRVTGEHNDTRLMLEEQSARNAVLEKRQKKFDAEMQQLQESLRQEKAGREKALRERDLATAEKTSAEQNLAACRLELDMRDEKVAALGRELEELAFGGAAEEEVAALRKAKHALERRVKEQEEELDELAGQVGLLEAAKVRLEMGLEQQRKEARREASQRDDELEEVRGNAHKKVRALECQLETEHEERTRLLRERHELERRIAEAAESARGRNPEDEQTIQRLRRELRHAKALLKDAHGLLERQRDESSRGHLRALRHQLEDAEAARAVAMKARQTAEAEARELTAALEEERRARAIAEDRAAAAVRGKTEVTGQLEENEEELAEVMKKYKAAVSQIGVEQASTAELAVTAATLEAERNSLREQVAEMSARLEAVEGETAVGLTTRRLETKIRELESRLELEATTRARSETQSSRFKEQAEKMSAEAEAARSRETVANDAARRAARQVREAREREAALAAKEAEAVRKRKELDLRVETAEAEAATARADLRLALQRIEDLQAAMAGDSEDDLGSESSGSMESLIGSFTSSHEFLDFACRSPEGQSDPGEGTGPLTDSKDESHA